jgi:transposase
MSTSKQPSHRPSGRRYPPELKERAVRMVREATAENGERFGVVTRVARQLGGGAETLRLWVNQAEVDSGQRPGLSTDEGRRIAALEREIRELRRANEILKAASAFFARYSDIGITRVMPTPGLCRVGASANSDQHGEVGIISGLPGRRAGRLRLGTGTSWSWVEL